MLKRREVPTNSYLAALCRTAAQTSLLVRTEPLSVKRLVCLDAQMCPTCQRQALRERGGAQSP